MAKTKETDEQSIWRIMMNTPGPEAIRLYEVATKILTTRCIIKPARKRKEVHKPKQETK